MTKARLVALAVLLMPSLGCTQAAAPIINDGDPPRITGIGVVAPDILSIKVDERRAEYGAQVPYEPQDDDRIDTPEHHRWVLRGGKVIGALAGPDGDLMREIDAVVGEHLDIDWATDPSTYSISSTGDGNYANAASPVAIYRKSKPTALARTDSWRFDGPVGHVLYLRLPEALVEGAEYAIEFDGGPFEAQTFAYAPESLRSEAVHATHLGFRPDDPAKVAFLSCWMGDGGPLDYSELRFSVLDDGTGESVYDGTLRLSKAKDATDEDAYKTNHNGTDVYEADFSDLADPGTYRVYVEGIGCSYPFPISDTAWRDSFLVSARGFYHQRSGIELGPPHTEYARPRCFHPGDGVAVYHSACALMDSGNGLSQDDDGNFGHLVAGKTDQIVADAWGGYMDAGDWDRRIQHLNASRLLLELVEMHPDYYAEFSLNIPESGDGLPDLVSEALFNLDCYRRMQTPEGGIRGGIESAEHPANGDASWQESLDIMAYAPGVWSSHVYAGVAARAAYVLEGIDPDRASIYADSALKAMEWAERELPNRPDDDHHAVLDARNLAAAEMYRLTGEDRWHQIFLDTTAFSQPNVELFVWEDHDQRDAPWVYISTQHDGVDEQIRKNCLAAILAEADNRTARADITGFRWTKYEWMPSAWGAFSAPDGESLVRAHVLTGEDKYLRALVLASQTGAGANPVNMCFTTGLGHSSPLNPLHIDSQITHQPPPGLTVFGPLNAAQGAQDWAHDNLDKTCYPPSREWPVIEAYFDVFWYPAMCEFTVQTPMARNAFTWGHLAARE